MPKAQWSIAWRLAVTLAIGLAVVWIGAATIAAGTMSRSLNQSFDEALRQSAFRLLQLAVAHGDYPLEPVGGLGDNGEYLTYFVLDPAGAILVRAEDAPPDVEVGLVAEGFSTVDGRRAFRFTHGPGYSIVVMELTDHRAEAIASSVAALMWPLLALMPLMGFGSWYAIRIAMRPVATLSGDISRRGGRNLAPLEANGHPRELAPIAEAVDSLLGRLRSALDAERAFAASSAHELRTPIAGALAQTQLLAKELRTGPGSNRVRDIETALKKLSQLAERLLQMARLEAGFANAETPQDLLPVLSLVVDDFLMTTAFSRVRLTIAPGVDLVAHTTLDAFAIAVRNLIENALIHGESGGRVDVIAGPGRMLRVISDGPTLSAERIEELAKPFVRGMASTYGTGIGLSIVRAIVDQSGAVLELRSPASGREGGFEAIITWDREALTSSSGG